MFIVLLHGSHHGPWIWKYFEKYFMKKNYKIINLKLIKDENKIYTINDYSEILYNTVNELDNYIIIAHSLGSFIVQYTLLKYNLTPNKIYLLNPLTLDLLFVQIFYMYYYQTKILLKSIIYGNLTNNIDETRMLLFTDKSDDKIIKECYFNLNKINNTKMSSLIIAKLKFTFSKYNNIKFNIILSEKDNFIKSKSLIAHKNATFKYFYKSGHNIMLDQEWKSVCNYIHYDLFK